MISATRMCGYEPCVSLRIGHNRSLHVQGLS